MNHNLEVFPNCSQSCIITFFVYLSGDVILPGVRAGADLITDYLPIRLVLFCDSSDEDLPQEA